MKEYKLVCDVDIYSRYDGTTTHLKGAAPFYNGKRHYESTTDKEKLVEEFASYLDAMREFDIQSKERNDGYPFANEYTQRNLRIQSRTITDWEDE